MPTDTIITTLLAAAAFLKEPVQALASQSLREVYAATKYYLRKKFGADSSAAAALEAATAKPDSPGRKLTLLEESAPAQLESDPELRRLIQTLAALLGGVGVLVPAGNVTVMGSHRHVAVAGRDLIQTHRHVVRNAVTPDASHLSAEQVAALRPLIVAVADRLADASGTPNFAAVHRQLQRRFRIASYLLIPADRFADAVAFLKRQRAAHRGPLRRRNPAAYAQDLFRAIHAASRQRGWDREQLGTFAQARLGLREPVRSLRELGPNQLRTLAAALRRPSPSAPAT